MEGKKGIANILLSFILLLAPAIAVSSSYEPYLQKIQKRYSRLPGLILSYKRELISKSLDMLGRGMKEDIGTGKIFLKPPCLLRIEQQKPTHEIIINNGKEIWWYIPSRNTAYRYKTADFGKELHILKDIFTGMNDIKKGFDISLEKGDRDIFLLLRPVRPWQDIEKIRIQIDSHDFRIRMVKIYNLLGSITCFRLDNEIRADLKKGIFSIHIPEGTRIIER